VAAALLLVLGLVLGVARLSSLRRQAAAHDDAVCSANPPDPRELPDGLPPGHRQLSGGRSRAAGIPRVSASDVLADAGRVHARRSDAPARRRGSDTTAVRVQGNGDGFGKVEEIVSALRKDKCFGEIKPAKTDKAARATR